MSNISASMSGALASIVRPAVASPDAWPVASAGLVDVPGLLSRVASLEADAEQRWLLVAAAGHDVRQPLQIILRALQLLSSGAGTDKATFWYDAALAQIGRVTTMLDQLVASSRRALSPASAPSAMVDLEALLSGIARDAADAAHAKNLTLRVVADAGLLRGDIDVLRTIVGNLVANAIKYTERGGVKLVGRVIDDAVLVEVIDTGRGFDPAAFDGYRQPFVQADPASEGIGLGLWLVDRLCASAQLTMTCASKPGFGTRFRIAGVRADDPR